jgi:hypothetical protein
VWDKDAAVRLDALKTVKSAKDVFFPQTEDLVKSAPAGKKFRSRLKNRSTKISLYSACAPAM